MAIDPSRSVPQDVATVQSLQSTTEESAKAAMRAPVDASWGDAQFSLGGLLGTLGRIIGGAVELGVGLLVEVANGVINFIGGIANAIANIFGGSSSNPEPPTPPEPIFNPIKTNLEQVLGPRFEELDQLMADSAGLGDESKTIQQQMRELIDPENPESELWLLQDQVNTLNNDRNDLQDQMIELNRKNLDSLTEYISRSIFIPRDTPVTDEYFTITRTTNGHRWRVTAVPGWSGHYVWQSVYYFDSGDASPVIDGREVGITRQWDEYAWNRNPSILTYWVRKGVHQLDDLTSPAYTTALGAWSVRSDLTFTATETADHDLYYRVTWAAATYDDVYSFRVRRNGVTLYQWGPFVKVGPMFSFQSGVRTRTIYEFGVPLTAGDVVTFETFSDASTTSQRAVSSSERKISWLSAS